MASVHDPAPDPGPAAPPIAGNSAGEGAGASPPGPVPGTPAPPSGDPLLAAVLWLCKHHGVERTPQSLLSGFAIDQRLTPQQAVQVLHEAGFNATLIQRAPSKILSLLLPAVLLLNSGDAAIATRRLAPVSRRGLTLRRRVSGTTRYELVLPGGDNQTIVTSEDELLSEYSGYALVATLRHTEDAAVAGDPDLKDPAHHWLWGTLRKFRPYYRSAMLAAMLSNLLMLVTGFFTSVVYDRVIPNQAFTTLWSLAIGAFVAIGFDLAARQLRSYLIDLAGRKADIALGTILFRHALSLKLEHKPHSAGAFAHHLAMIEVVREFSTSATLSAITDLPFIFVFIAMTWFIAGPLVVVLLLAVPIVLLLSWGVQSVLRRVMSANMRQQADLHGVLVEAVEGLEDVRAAGAQAHFRQRYEEANTQAAMSALRSRSLSSWVNNFSMIMQQLITVIMLVWGVHLIHDGNLSNGALIAAVMFSGRAIAPLNSVVGLASRYQGARAAMRSLDELMALPTEREPGKQYLARPRLDGGLGMREVQFAYPAGPHEHSPQVLKGVSLQIQPGERIAILGKIGSGKSTILRLLGGLYQPTDGLVEVDNIDLRQIDPGDFRAQVGFVSQDPRLFQGTLKENILMGRPHADAGELIDVARLTGLDKMASSHPMGYDLPVGEMGALLSGGQRQLVALARCLVTKPRILLLDEPTSSMDAQAEASFIQHLRTAAGDRTLVLVTHRPALLELVNRVIVVEAGRILADGPKAAVLAALAGKQPPRVGQSPPPQPGPATHAQHPAAPAQPAAGAAAPAATAAAPTDFDPTAIGPAPTPADPAATGSAAGTANPLGTLGGRPVPDLSMS